MDSQDKGASPIKGFLTYFYGNFVVLLLGFIQTPLLTRILATDEYGKTGMFETAVTVIYIFAVLGLDQAYIRYYYEKDIDRVVLLKRCLLPALCIVTALSLVYIMISESANDFLFGATGRDVVALVVIYTFISVLELCSMGSLVVSVSRRGDGYDLSFAGGDIDEILEQIEE